MLSPNFFPLFSFRNSESDVDRVLRVVVELRRFCGALFRNIHETTMEWSECARDAAAESERGTAIWRRCPLHALFVCGLPLRFVNFFRAA